MIELREVTVRASKDADDNAIDRLSLRLEASVRTAILGGSGSGKTVLGLVIAGLISPDSGAVSSGDSRIAYLGGNPDDQFVCHSVGADVAFRLECERVDSCDIRDRVTDALVELGISDLELKGPHQLSGGQKQMVALAGAMIARPTHLILDDATSMIDHTYRPLFEAAVRKVQGLGATVIDLTSDPEIAALADRVVLLGLDGKVMANGNTSSVLSGVDLLREAGLSPTAVTKLWLSGLIPGASKSERSDLQSSSVPVTVAELSELLDPIEVVL